MAVPRTLLAEIRLDGGAPTGVLVDERGRCTAFHGWLELIAAVQAAEAGGPATGPGGLGAVARAPRASGAHPGRAGSPAAG